MADLLYLCDSNESCEPSKGESVRTFVFCFQSVPYAVCSVDVGVGFVRFVFVVDSNAHLLCSQLWILIDCSPICHLPCLLTLIENNLHIVHTHTHSVVHEHAK